MSGTFKLLRVFVYGTLKNGEPNHHWLAKPENGSASFYGTGQTTRKYPLVIASRYNIPFILDEPGKGNNVCGEVYEVDTKMLKNLDILEGHPHYYTRRTENITMDNLTEEECWTYFLQNHRSDLLQLPMLASYTSRGDDGLVYVEPSKRDPSYDYKPEVVLNNPHGHAERGSSTSKLLKVFVYGTLKNGEPNHHWLTKEANGHARFVSEGQTVVKYPLVIASKYNIPFLLDEPNVGHNVFGEIYEIDSKMFSNLDILEGYPEFYKRRLESIQTMVEGSAAVDRCWTYFLNGYKRHLLELPFWASYSSAGEHGLPYAERYQRDPNYDVKADVIDFQSIIDNEATIDDV